MTTTNCRGGMSSFIVVAVSLAVSQPLAAEMPGSIPETAGALPETFRDASAHPGDKPLWVSAWAAFDANGRPRAELLAPDLLRHFERQESRVRRSAAEPGAAVEPRLMDVGECRGTSILVSGGLTRTLAQTLEDPYVWFRGTVETASPGFLSGMPGTLLKIKVARELGTPIGTRSSAGVLVFASRAQFAVGSWEFCTGELPPLRQGAMVIVVARSAPGTVILNPGEGGIFGEDSTGTLEVARGWRTESLLRGVKSLSQLEAVVDNLLGARRAKSPQHGGHDAARPQ
jgi:hypothetical protein